LLDSGKTYFEQSIYELILNHITYFHESAPHFHQYIKKNDVISEHYDVAFKEQGGKIIYKN